MVSWCWQFDKFWWKTGMVGGKKTTCHVSGLNQLMIFMHQYHVVWLWPKYCALLCWCIGAPLFTLCQGVKPPPFLISLTLSSKKLNPTFFAGEKKKTLRHQDNVVSISMKCSPCTYWSVRKIHHFVFILIVLFRSIQQYRLNCSSILIETAMKLYETLSVQLKFNWKLDLHSFYFAPLTLF